MDRNKISVLIPPIGWCSPPPKTMRLDPENPYQYDEGYLVEVPSSPKSLVVTTVQENLDTSVAVSRSSLTNIFRLSDSDNFPLSYTI